MTTNTRPNPISCHLITWGRDLETGMREASELGYRACETFPDHALAYEDRAEEYQELLASRGLRLSALYVGARFADPGSAEETVAYCERVARFLGAVGADRIVFGPGGRREGAATLEQLRRMARTVEEAAMRTYALGVLACVHPHLGMEIQDRAEIDALMELTDPELVRFCPDTGQLAAAGMDPAEVIRTYGSRIGYVHLKDLAPELSADALASYPWGGGAPIFTELGLGTLDLHAVVAALREAGYPGWITVELDKSTRTPRESLALCREYLRDELGLDLDTVPARTGPS